MRDASKRRRITFEGLTEGEILALPADELEGLILTGQPTVFRAGSATVLGDFKRDGHRLLIELARIDGGGEGVLLSLGSLAKRYARLSGIETVEWVVHAVNCAKPNLKLRRVLERRGFEVRDVPGKGVAYHLVDSVTDQDRTRAGWAESSEELTESEDDALVCSRTKKTQSLSGD